MNLNYSPEAKADLQSIYDYIAQDNVRSAEHVIARILQGMAVLERFPLIGREGRIDSTREWSISGLPYVGVYHIVDPTRIDIIAVIHTSRNWPEG